MICSKCGKEGIEPGDVFCRHCGFPVPITASSSENAGGVTEKNPATTKDPNTGKGLEIIGAALIFFVVLFVFGAAPLVGWYHFAESFFLWFSGAVMVTGVALIFVGMALHHAH